MTSSGAVRLVAGREIAVRARARSFLISTAVMVLGVVLGGLLLKAIGSSGPLEVGFVPETASLASSTAALLPPDTELSTTVVTDRASGEEQVRSGDLDALIVGSPDDLGVVVKDQVDPALGSALTALAQQQALASEVRSLGGDPAQVAEAVAHAAPEVTSLEPAQRDPGKIVAAYVVGILIFLALMTVGQMVAQGVVEEKTSRVVELLLATLRPWQLMAGKVLGIGVVGLAQVAVVTAAGAGTAIALGLLDATSLDLGSTLAWVLVWFVIGFLTYAVTMAALAALVSRQEEVASVTGPVTMLMVVPYVVGISIGVWDPNNPLVVWLSYLPFSAPFVMPIRVAGGTPAWEAMLAAGISIAVIPLLIWLAGRMYSGAILHTGSRMKVLQALRG